MRTPNARLLACALAASVVLGSVVVAEPALAAPAASCVEPHAAKVARKTLRAFFTAEAAALVKASDAAKDQLATATGNQQDVLADPGSTEADKGRAAAAVALPTTLIALAADAKADLKVDRAKVTRCGLPAMKHLAVRVKDRDLQLGIDALTASRTATKAYLKWDTVTRDSYVGVDEDARETWANYVIADEDVIEALNHAIRKLRKQLS